SVADDGKTVTLSGYLQETFCEAITEYGFIYCGGSATKGCTPTKNSPRLKVTPSTQLYRGEKFTVTTVLPVNTTYGYKAYIMVGEIMYISAETGFFTLGDCTNKPTNLSTITYTVDASLGEEFADPCTLTFGNLQKAIDHLKNANSPELGLYQYVDKVGSSYNLKQPVVMNVVYYDDTPDDDTKAYIYRGTTSVGKHAGENAPKNSNLIENINLDGAEPSHTLTIKAGTKVAKPWIHHIVLRKSKNIVLDSLCIYSDPNGVGDNAIEMDINVATKGEGWNALNNQTGTGIKDNYLDNANIMVKNCMIGSDGFTGMHISSYNGVTFKNNDFESVFDKGSNNDINYGASAKFLYCKNIKFIENNFRGDHATLMWIQEVQNMLVMNNVFWNTNKYQQKQGTHVPAAMRVVTQWNPTKNIGFYYNTYFFADNGETWTESKYNFLHFSHTVSGGSGSYNLGTMYFKYNNCYSYDPDCPGDEDINISGYENNFCPNNFWSEYDKINSKSTSVFAFGCSGNTFTNVKTQVCETSATGPASLIVNRTAMNLGSAPTGDELLGFTLTTDEARGDRYYSNVRPVGSGWTYGAYQSKAEAPTDVIYWLGLSDDWDDRNNWEYYAPEDPTDPESPMIRQRVSCVNTFSEDLKVVIEEIGSLEISGGRKWPLIPSSFDADERRTNSKADVPQNEQVSAGASGKFASIIELEYGAGIIGVENLGDGIYYDEASMSFTAPRKQWILVGTVVKPFDENGNPRNIKSGDYFITGQTPHVYMHKAEIVGDKAKWDETFTSLETEVEPTTVFAIQVPDQYGKYKLPARYYNTSNKTNFNPDEPIEYGKYAGSKGPFNGEFVNQSSVPTYTGLTAGQPVLLNNSYPANIDAKVLESVSGGTVQYYNYESGTFLNTSSTSEQVLLKPQHGFIFTPAVGENSLTIENVEGMFVNGNTRSRSLEVEVPTLSINVVNANTGVAFGNAVVRYDELLANGEESASNVEKVFSPNQDAPELYIIANDKMYSRLDVNPSTTVIPLGVRLKQDMNIKFIKEYFNGFSYATLVDTYTDKETDLLRNSYITETLVAGDIEGRFFLNLQLADDSNEEDDDDNVSTEVEEDDATNGAINIFVDESNNIRVATNGVELQTIYVSDMAGKTMKYNVRGYAATLNLPVAQGVYTLNVIGDKANRTEKVILK
ncbi:MAG: T9SS type A sorting domain-containing protein, partial [Paludibacteraceae bacterium]|nr:T9SS type A sorting domain-containing protein [Paludibacteraceae bacterium]